MTEQGLSQNYKIGSIFKNKYNSPYQQTEKKYTIISTDREIKTTVKIQHLSIIDKNFQQYRNKKKLFNLIKVVYNIKQPLLPSHCGIVPSFLFWKSRLPRAGSAGDAQSSTTSGPCDGLVLGILLLHWMIMMKWCWGFFF